MNLISRDFGLLNYEGIKMKISDIFKIIIGKLKNSFNFTFTVTLPTFSKKNQKDEKK